MSGRMRIVVPSLAAAVSLVVLVFFHHPVAAGCRDWTDLSPTSDGEAVAAIGRAAVRSSDSTTQQAFTVEANVDVPDGTPLFVVANGLPAGTFTVFSGIGTLNLSDANGAALPAGVQPVCEIGPVSITDMEGTTLLTGNF
jgi:hypothetical protein